MTDPGASAEQSHPGDEGGSYADWVGRVIDDRYRIEGMLGEGGMGAVFEAEHLKLMKRVALKVIHPQFAGDGEVAKRFVREAMASAQMEHPHVASATDYGTLEEGGAYLVMQLIRGESLRDVLAQSGALGWVRACEVGAQVADALSDAHKRGIVHRDLKPDNVMLEPRDDGSRLVKVLDFGIARVADEKLTQSGQALTRVGTVIGTPGYMAPEQALGESVDFRVDLYALGLLLYEMATGKRLFEIDDLTAIVTRQLTEDCPRVSELVRDVPIELDDLVARMLEKDRERRPESAGDVREALRSLILGATLQAVASGEQEIPKLGTTELAGASAREPTPLSVRLEPREDPKRPPAAVAPTMMAAPTPSPSAPSGGSQHGAASPAPSTAGRRASIPTPIRETAAAARASTMDALEKVKAKGLPLPLIGAGCAGLTLLGITLLGIAIFGGSGDLVKQEHERPVVVEPTEEEDEAPLVPSLPIPDAIPAALSQAHADVLLSESRRDRRRAAQTILAHEPRDDVPEFLVVVAELERATTCNRKKPHVERLGELGDPRALPALERLDASPRNGCRRLFQRFDCYGCMRDALKTSIEALRSEM